MALEKQLTSQEGARIDDRQLGNGFSTPKFADFSITRTRFQPAESAG